jgi:serine/threonine-protein phosphatase 2A regulatory subunit B''
MTTAKQSPSSDDRRSSSASSSLELSEEIENIAKQISDHAEAIYQEWKARGLAPTEILKCHPGSENLTFNQTLNPKLSPTSVHAFEQALLENAPDLSNSNLKKLVNSFVNEDKARLAAQRTDGGAGRCSPSIASTLQKFENPSESPPSYKLATSSRSPINTPTSGNSSSSSSDATSSITNLFPKSEQNQKILFQIPDVLKDTIEQCAKRQKPETPVKPNHLLNHVPQWPLKKKSSLSKSNSASDNDIQKIDYDPQYSLIADDQQDIDVMDEVSREEEKLINALKTGTVLSSDSLPEVISSSLNEYKLQTEQLLNGLASKSRKMAQGNNVIDSSSQNQQPQPPQKPNHTPIYVPPKEDNSRGFSSFSRIGAANTRIPNRHEISKLDEKKFELKSIPSPVRPFLSRGSVAERVLIFEKCPEKAPARQVLQEKPKVSVSCEKLF